MSRKVVLGVCAVLLALGVGALFVFLGGDGASEDAHDVAAPRTDAAKAEAERDLDAAPATSATTPEHVKREQLAADAAGSRASAWLFGSLRTSAGAELDVHSVKIRVRTRSPDGALNWPEAKIVVDVVNDTRGSYRVGPLAPGHYRAWWVADDSSAEDLLFEVTADTRELRHDVVFEAEYVLPVHLRTPDGKPLAREILDAAWFQPPFPIEVVATREPLAVGALAPRVHDGEHFASRDGRVANEDDTRARSLPMSTFALHLGRVREGSDYIGDLVIGARPVTANVLWRRQVLANLTITPATEELVVVLDPARFFEQLAAVRVTVVDERDRAPIAGATVTAELASDEETSLISIGTFRRDPKVIASARTGADGVAHLTGLGRGRTLVRAAAEGHLPWARWFELPPARVTELGEAPLALALQVDVRVVDATGRDIEHPLEFVELDSRGFEAEPIRERLPAGGATLTTLAARRYVVRSWRGAQLFTQRPSRNAPAAKSPMIVDGAVTTAFEPGTLAVTPALVDLTTPPTTTLVLRAEPQSQVALELAFEGDERVFVRVSTADGLPAANFHAEPRGRALVLLPHGVFAVMVEASGLPLANGRVTVDAENVTLKLP